eukprot:TRINITY_DN3477_c0_g1_i1.p1 TRINITY_DN3477_c0_g1~~TRINITY_DN3477_c0_g1_i1.p1  ORF type:complete len:860 (-),score=142.12 TRINITY_DN3477_c0_g1_i1:85-2664(-)
MGFEIITKHHKKWSFLFLLLVLGCFNIVHGQNSVNIQNVVIGMSLDLHPSTNPIMNPGSDMTADLNRAAYSQKLYNGLKVWNQIFGDVVHTYGNVSIRYKLRMMDDNGNITKMIANYQYMSNSPNFNFLFGPIQSDFTLAAAYTWENAGKLMLSTSAASQDVVLGRKYSYSLLAPSNRYLITAIPIWSNAGLKTIAFINEDILQFSQCCGSLYDNAPDFGMTVLGNRTLAPVGNTLTQDQYIANLEALKYIQSLQPDVLVICSYQANTQQLLTNTKTLNYLPKAIHTMLIQQAFVTLPEANFITASAQWLNDLNLPPDSWYGSPSSFSEIYEQTYGVSPDSSGALGAIGPIVIEQAVASAMANYKVYTSDAVRDALQALKINSFFGNIGFSADHLSLHENAVVQYVNGKIIPIAPLSVAESTYIFPMPTYEERVFVPPHYFGTKEELAIGIITIFLLFLCLLLSVVVFKFWRNNYDLWMVLLGCALCLLTSFLWMREINPYTCQGLPWMLGLGICMLYQAMALLSWKADATRKRDEGLGTSSHKITKILKFTGIILAVEVLILILITTISPLKSTTVVVDPLRPGLNRLSCQGSNLITPILIAILVIYHLLVMIYGLVLAWKIFSVSRYLALALINISVLLIIVLITQMSVLYGNSPHTQVVTIKLVLRCLGLMIASFGTTCLIFYPRIRSLVVPLMPHSEGDSSDEEGGIPMKVHTPLGNVVQSLQQELEQQRARIRELEESLKMQPEPPMKTVTIQGPSKFIYYNNTPNNIHLTKNSPENQPHVSFNINNVSPHNSPPLQANSLRTSTSPSNSNNININNNGNNNSVLNNSPISSSSSLSQIIIKDKKKRQKKELQP